MAKRSTDKAQLDLFAEPEEVLEPPPREWLEVPQERFLSWGRIGQLRYCAERDRNSALTGDNSEWFLARAAMYEKAIASEGDTGHGL